MKVKFRKSETAKEHEVEFEAPQYYILKHHPNNWSEDCFIAVRKSAVDVVEEVNYMVGQRFKVGHAQESYILSYAGPGFVMLVNLKTGWRWDSEPKRVNDINRITQDEMKQFSNNVTLIT